MIFVTVGTGEQQFDRLLCGVESLSTEEPLVIQHGSSSVRPMRGRCVEFMSFTDLLSHMREATVVITHAGVGSMTAALSAGKRPVVVPRRQRFGEAVDDHQVEIARRLAESKLVTLVEDPKNLESALAAPAEEMGSPLPRETRLNRDLRSYLASCCVAVEGR